jgi:hypothetical protein
MSEQRGETVTRIGVDELAEAVTRGVLRAVSQSVDVKEFLGQDKAVVINPVIKYGGRLILTSAAQLQVLTQTAGEEL